MVAKRKLEFEGYSQGNNEVGNADIHGGVTSLSRAIRYQALSRFSARNIEKLGGAWGRGYSLASTQCM